MLAGERAVRTLSAYRVEAKQSYDFGELAPIINIKAQFQCKSSRKPLYTILHISGRVRFSCDATSKRR